MQSIRQYRQLRHAVREELTFGYDALTSGETTPTHSDKPSSNQHRLLSVVQKVPSLSFASAEESTPSRINDVVVGWSGPDDPLRPHNWPLNRRILATTTVILIIISVTATSSIEAAVTPQAAAAFHVSEVAASLTTGIYLIGFAIGSLFAGALSETFGRNVVYIVALSLYMVFIMGSALAPNFASIIVMRFLSGLFGSTPLTVGGGTIADIYTPLETALSFPLLAVIAFGGPLLGPVMGAYIGDGPLSFRWAEWVMLMFAGLVLVVVIVFQPETYAPVLLEWKTSHFRKEIGEDCFRPQAGLNQDSMLRKLRENLIRPFAFVYTELIVLLFAIYLTLLYIVLFTFFSGYVQIFTITYQISQGMTNILFLAVLVGVLFGISIIPLVYAWTKKELEDAASYGRPPRPEIRLWYAMLGGSASIPISLFWVGWTCYSDISIWVPLTGTAFFGYGLFCIFTSAYMYIIDVYQIYAASALSFNAFARYLVAGAMTTAGIPMYESLGPHWTCTLLGVCSVILLPVPYVLYFWGPSIRKCSKNTVARAS